MCKRPHFSACTGECLSVYPDQNVYMKTVPGEPGF